MAIKDAGLGIELITLRDLLGWEPSEAQLDGVTVQESRYRARAERFDDTGKIKLRITRGLTSIQFWVVLDCGEDKDNRFKPVDWPFYDQAEPRKHRYIPAAVGVEQSISDVEREESGKALPGHYNSFDEACEVSSDLSAVCEIHEA